MSAYAEWLEQVRAAHRRRQGHGARHSGCWVCDVLQVDAAEAHRCRALSAGIVDGHHVIPKQTLKRELGGRPTVVAAWLAGRADEEPVLDLDQALWDPRNGLPLRRYHHDAWEGAALSVPREMLPACIEDFAREVSLTWWLDRSFGT